MPRRLGSPRRRSRRVLGRRARCGRPRSRGGVAPRPDQPRRRRLVDVRRPPDHRPLSRTRAQRAVVQCDSAGLESVERHSHEHRRRIGPLLRRLRCTGPVCVGVSEPARRLRHDVHDVRARAGAVQRAEPVRRGGPRRCPSCSTATGSPRSRSTRSTIRRRCRSWRRRSATRAARRPSTTA